MIQRLRSSKLKIQVLSIITASLVVVVTFTLITHVLMTIITTIFDLSVNILEFLREHTV